MCNLKSSLPAELFELAMPTACYVRGRSTVRHNAGFLCHCVVFVTVTLRDTMDRSCLCESYNPDEAFGPVLCSF